MTKRITIELTPRQFALIRVACIQRLDRIKDRTDCGTSYNETREMLMTVLEPYAAGRNQKEEKA